MLSVRQAAPDDRDAIFEFIRTAYAGREQYKIPERWHWQFVDNPYIDPDSEDLPIWIATDNGRVVGQTGAMIEPIKYGAWETSVGWSVDTFVLAKYRGRGLGMELQQLNQRSHPLFMSLKMSKQNARLKAKIGGVELSPVHVMELRLGSAPSELSERIRRRSRLLDTCAKRTGVTTAVSAAVSSKARRRWQAKTVEFRREVKEVEITEVAEFSDEFTQIWQRSAGSYNLAVNRCAKYFRWKFDQQPHVQHHRLVARRKGRACGYIVVRCGVPPEPSVGIIDDLVAENDDEDLIRTLTIFAVERFLESGVQTVKVASSAQPYIRAFQSLGFRLTRKLTPMCNVNEKYGGLPSPSSATGDQERFAGGTMKTFFTYGDHDLDQFPLVKA